MIKLERIERELDRLKQRLLIRTRMARTANELARSRCGYRLVSDAYWDYRYGGQCGRKEHNRLATSGAVHVQAVHYALLDRILGSISILPDDVLVDVGCGRGRVINWWLRRGCSNRIVGLEILPDIADWARQRLLRFRNVEIVTGDAVLNAPPDGTLFFLYNPFDATTMQAFVGCLMKGSQRLPQVRIVYFNCRHLEPFQTGAWAIEELRTTVRERGVLIRYVGDE